MNENKQTQFYDQLDMLLLISEEAIESSGEDSFFCGSRANSAMTAVFDGCGGLGARQYPVFQGKTGAYIASRLVSGAVHDWYCAEGDRHWSDGDALVSSLHQYISEAYAIGTAYNTSNLRIRGALVRDFPTTASIALVRHSTDGLVLHVIWSGDSRVYLMDADGLAQLTADDTDSPDALTNLSDDASLTNVLSSDGKFTLHYKCMKLCKPTVVFTATDGCFGYLPSPMEFEYTILNALEEAKNTDDFKSRLKTSIHNVTGDDFALGLLCFGYGTFDNLKEAFVDRLISLEREYIVPLQNNRTKDYTQQLWQMYRQSYERYL